MKLKWRDLQLSKCTSLKGLLLVFLMVALVVGANLVPLFSPTDLILQAQAETLSPPRPNVSHTTAELISDVQTIQPGVPFKVGAELTQESGWHTYYKDCGDAGMPTKIIWELPKGFTASEQLWEKPSKFDDGGIVTFGYQKRNLVAATITPPKDVSGVQKIRARVKWLSCRDVCIPGEAEVSLNLTVADSPAQQSTQAAKFDNVGWTGNTTDLKESAEAPNSETVKKKHSKSDRIRNRSTGN